MDAWQSARCCLSSQLQAGSLSHAGVEPDPGVSGCFPARALLLSQAAWVEPKNLNQPAAQYKAAAAAAAAAAIHASLLRQRKDNR
jgi:hypothetical protein